MLLRKYQIQPQNWHSHPRITPAMVKGWVTLSRVIHPFMQMHPGTTKEFRQGSAQLPSTEQQKSVSEQNITMWDSIQLEGISKLYDEVIKQFLHWIYELIVTVISRSQWLVY